MSNIFEFKNKHKQRQIYANHLFLVVPRIFKYTAYQCMYKNLYVCIYGTHVLGHLGGSTKPASRTHVLTGKQNGFLVTQSCCYLAPGVALEKMK